MTESLRRFKVGLRRHLLHLRDVDIQKKDVKQLIILRDFDIKIYLKIKSILRTII